MDFLEIAYALDPVEKILTHPQTGATLKGHEDKPVSVNLFGVSHEQVKSVERKITNQRLNSAMRKGKYRYTAEQQEEDEFELLCACINGWQNLIYGGKLFPFSKENARKLLKEFPWFYNQIKEFVYDEENFIKGSFKTSSTIADITST